MTPFFERNSSYIAQILLLGFDPENLGSQIFLAFFPPPAEKIFDT